MKKRLLSLALILCMLLTLLPTAVWAAEREESPMGEEAVAVPVAEKAPAAPAKGHAPAELAEVHSHDGFTAWSTTDAMLTDAGSYYLDDNVTPNRGYWSALGNTNLCLNGKTLETEIGVHSGYILTVSDCQGTGQITNDGQAICLYNDSELVLESGTIVSTADPGDYPPSEAIYNAGFVTLKGGTVTGPYGVGMYYSEGDYTDLPRSPITLEGAPTLNGAVADISITYDAANTYPLIDAMAYTGDGVTIAIQANDDVALEGAPLVKLGHTLAEKFTLDGAEGYSLEEKEVDGVNCLVVKDPPPVIRLSWEEDSQPKTVNLAQKDLSSMSSYLNQMPNAGQGTMTLLTDLVTDLYVYNHLALTLTSGEEGPHTLTRPRVNRWGDPLTYGTTLLEIPEGSSVTVTNLTLDGTYPGTDDSHTPPPAAVELDGSLTLGKDAKLVNCGQPPAAEVAVTPNDAGGVYLGEASAALRMESGSAIQNGQGTTVGGVMMYDGTLTMTGGSITGNKGVGRWAEAGGVCLRGGTLTLSGGVVIKDNLVAADADDPGTPANVALSPYADPIQVVDALTGGANSIGITALYAPSVGSPVKVAEGAAATEGGQAYTLTEADLAAFFADQSGYFLTLNEEENAIYLNAAAITTQPTVDAPTVAVNYAPQGIGYQWYTTKEIGKTVVGGTNEDTDTTAAAASQPGEYAEATQQWTAYRGEYFSIGLKGGDKLTVAFPNNDMPTSGGLYLSEVDGRGSSWSHFFGTPSSDRFTVTDTAITCAIPAGVDGIFTLSISDLSNNATPPDIQATRARLEPDQPVDGQNTAALTTTAGGTYLCQVTWPGGFQLNSGVVTIPHVHAMSAGCETEGEGQVAFTSWTDPDNLPTTAGNYCLAVDVVLSERWSVPGGTTNLCLNGHTISITGTGYTNMDSPIYFRDASAVLNLCDCSEEQTGGVNAGERDTAIDVDGTLRLYGGTVKGNLFGVIVGGAFEMHGGSVTDTTDSRHQNNEIYGAAVLVENGDTFRMTGGAISGNMRGVQVEHGGTFLVEGNVIIADNETANVWLEDNASDPTVVYLTGALGEAAKLGLSQENWERVDDSAPLKAVQGQGYTVTEADFAKLTSDDPDYPLRLADGVVSFIVGPRHTHAVSVGCERDWGEQVTFTRLSAKDGALYIGTQKLERGWEDQYELPGGNYYLTEDIELGYPIVVPDDRFGGSVSLCLNGHQLKYTGADGQHSVIYTTWDLNICDCNGSDGHHTVTDPTTNESVDIAGGLITGGTNGGVFVESISASAFNLYGGAIAGNKGPRGGGVNLGNRVFMHLYGGQVSYNTWEQDPDGGISGFGGIYLYATSGYTSEVQLAGDSKVAHNVGGGIRARCGSVTLSGDAAVADNQGIGNQPSGVYLGEDSTLAMSGSASVTGNHITTDFYLSAPTCGGVYAPSGGVTLSGGAKIWDNKINQPGGMTVAADLVLGSEFDTEGSDALVTIGSPLTADAKIGVSLLTSGQRVFTTGGGGDYADRFTSRQRGRFVEAREGELSLTPYAILQQPTQANACTVTVNGAPTSYKWYPAKPAEVTGANATAYTTQQGESSSCDGQGVWTGVKDLYDRYFFTIQLSRGDMLVVKPSQDLGYMPSVQIVSQDQDHVATGSNTPGQDGAYRITVPRDGTYDLSLSSQVEDFTLTATRLALGAEVEGQTAKQFTGEPGSYLCKIRYADGTTLTTDIVTCSGRSATPTPSAQPSAAPSARPSVTPSATPSAVPSATPSTTPSAAPSTAPSTTPSAAPTATPDRGDVTGEVEVKGDTPAVTVDEGSLKDLAGQVSEGERVTVKLTVEKQDAPADKADIEAVVTGDKANVLYLDLSLVKRVNDQTPEAITDTGDKVLEIVVPYDLTGKTDVSVYRKHGDSAAEKLTRSDARTDGTYRLEGAGAQGKVYIYASKFSTYAIGYTAVENLVSAQAPALYLGSATPIPCDGSTVSLSGGGTAVFRELSETTSGGKVYGLTLENANITDVVRTQLGMENIDLIYGAGAYFLADEKDILLVTLKGENTIAVTGTDIDDTIAALAARSSVMLTGEGSLTATATAAQGKIGYGVSGTDLGVYAPLTLEGSTNAAFLTGSASMSNTLTVEPAGTQPVTQTMGEGEYTITFTTLRSDGQSVTRAVFAQRETPLAPLYLDGVAVQADGQSVSVGGGAATLTREGTDYVLTLSGVNVTKSVKMNGSYAGLLFLGDTTQGLFPTAALTIRLADDAVIDVSDDGSKMGLDLGGFPMSGFDAVCTGLVSAVGQLGVTIEGPGRLTVRVTTGEGFRACGMNVTDLTLKTAADITAPDGAVYVAGDLTLGSGYAVTLPKSYTLSPGGGYGKALMDGDAPAGRVTVEKKTTVSPSRPSSGRPGTVRPTQSVWPFTDVAVTDAFYESVKAVYEKGWMLGTSDTTFSPEGELTRAMLATILYRAAGSPRVEGAPGFEDTLADTWYSDAIVWASRTQVLRGYGNGKFGPNDPVSKEMMNMVTARQAGQDPAWVGDSALAAPATRSEIAELLHKQEEK